MPFNYYVRSATYESTVYETYESCEPGASSAVCIQEEEEGAGVPGIQVVEGFSQIYPVVDPEDNTVRDILILVLIGIGWKIVFVLGAIIKTRRVATISSTSSTPTQNKHGYASPPKRILSDDYSQTLLSTQRQQSSIGSNMGKSPYAMPCDFDEEISV